MNPEVKTIADELVVLVDELSEVRETRRLIKLYEDFLNLSCRVVQRLADCSDADVQYLQYLVDFVTGLIDIADTAQMHFDILLPIEMNIHRVNPLTDTEGALEVIKGWKAKRAELERQHATYKPVREMGVPNDEVGHVLVELKRLSQMVNEARPDTTPVLIGQLKVAPHIARCLAECPDEDARRLVRVWKLIDRQMDDAVDVKWLVDGVTATEVRYGLSGELADAAGLQYATHPLERMPLRTEE